MSLKKLGIVTRHNSRPTEEIFYDPDTKLSKVVSKIDDGSWVHDLDETVNIGEILAKFGVPDDIREKLAVIMDVPEEKRSNVRYCTAHCGYAFNWGDQQRCENCGSALPGLDTAGELEDNTVLYMDNARAWADVRQALKLVDEGKLNAYTFKNSGYSYNLVFGYPDRIFNKKEHSFRGRANLAIYKKYENSCEFWYAEDQTYWPESNLCQGLLNFANDHGAKLVEGKLVELAPDVSATLRKDYIFKQWEFGSTPADDGNRVHPKQFFISQFFRPAASRSEVVSEASWAIYTAMLEKAQTNVLVRSSGKVMWRWGSITEVYDPELVTTILRDQFNATDSEIEKYVLPALEDGTEEE